MMLEKICYSIAFGCLCFTYSAYAADFVVEKGTTETLTQTLSDDGDQGLIEEGGSIETVPDYEYGVEMQADYQTLMGYSQVFRIILM